ncbi:MAG: hypothetical protein KC729_06695 [Candidatus Eisenbacteria bacterium]|uniref:Uncharacterized protein n=1 Tax=Eiseniibacteriota bacterium TaxID=2212470 RepID=A0A956LXU0_UNCEI|nr:hypothetical protein [Candidatus Eisenbacteria bacterium]
MSLELAVALGLVLSGMVVDASATQRQRHDAQSRRASLVWLARNADGILRGKVLQKQLRTTPFGDDMPYVRYRVSVDETIKGSFPDSVIDAYVFAVDEYAERLEEAHSYVLFLRYCARYDVYLEVGQGLWGEFDGGVLSSFNPRFQVAWA